MRSTRASAAVTRLNTRDTTNRYSMSITPNGYFYLLRTNPDGSAEKISEALSQDEFVVLANRTGPQKAVRISRFDAAFEQQLQRTKKSAE